MFKFLKVLLISPFIGFFLFDPALPAGNRGPREELSARRGRPSDYEVSEDDMVVTFIDVGQGNAVLVEAPSGKTLLYDAGGRPEWMTSSWDPGMEIVVPFLRELEIERIDYAVMSHAHGDHIGGFPAVLYNFDVGEFIDPGFPHQSSLYEELLEIVEELEITYRVLREGDGEKIDLGEEIRVEILSPPSDHYFRGTNSDANNSSILMRIIYGEVSFLLTGDLEERGEEYAVREHRGRLASNVLQVGHHGSHTSSTRPFLQQVQPEVAVIPVGARNVYGHPRPEVLSNLERVGAEVYRTDQDGHVTIYTDGEVFVVETSQ